MEQKENGKITMEMSVNLNIKNIPYILAVLLGYEEKGVEQFIDIPKNTEPTTTVSYIFNKWLEIFRNKNQENYGKSYTKSLIEAMAQEDIKYLFKVFFPINMTYTATIQQINKVIDSLSRFCEDDEKVVFDYFTEELRQYFYHFLLPLADLRLLKEESLNTEEKSLFSISDGKYDYKPFFQEHKDLFIPKSIQDSPSLMDEWVDDVIAIANNGLHQEKQQKLVRITS